MKRSLLALAALTAFAGAASAQSSVTLFGIMDAGIAQVKANGKTTRGMTNSGINSSRLGVRGVEDLGGGMSAGFWLEGQIFNDTGTGNGSTAAWTWQRRSTVSLMGGFGEVRLGRDYTPNFWNTTAYDPFGTNGVGQSMTPAMLGTALGSAAVASQGRAVRSDNGIAYRTPALGGFEGWVQMAFGENTGSGTKTNNYLGFRLGYAAGPISAHVSYAKNEGATDAADTKYFNVAGSFDAGVVKPMFQVAQEKTGGGQKVSAVLVGAVVPIGAGELRLAGSKYDLKNSSNDWNKLAVGYVQNLSKRTALYGTYARVSNKGAQVVSVTNNGEGTTTSRDSAPGGNSTGFEFGVRHAF